MATADRIRHAAGLVLADPDPVVVVSAMAGVTDRLSALITRHRAGDHAAIRGELSRLCDLHLGVARALAAGPDDFARVSASIQERVGRLEAVLTAPAGATGADDPVLEVRLTDEVTSAGEDLSAELMAAGLRARGRDSYVVDARSVIRTDGRFGAASPLEDVTTRQVGEHLVPVVRDGAVPVIQGFIGATVNGVTTTLGRGGSDFTAAILASCLEAGEASIWTAVRGIQSADPRTVPDARPLDEIGSEEAVELAYFGARVIHADAAKWAVSRGVSLRIRNSFDAQGPETRIRYDRRGTAEVAAVAHKPGVILIRVRAHPSSLPYGFLARVFGVLARHRLPVDLVATSHSSTAFTVDEDEELAAVSLELGEFADVDVIRGLATVTVVGHGLMEEPGVTGRVFEAVGETSVHLVSQASDVSLSFLVGQSEAPDVLRRIHERLVAPRAGVER
jgi:aspartate kinase